MFKHFYVTSETEVHSKSSCVNTKLTVIPTAVSLTSFYGKKPDDSPANNSPADSQDEGGDNLVSIVKRRRVMAAKAAQEKEERDLQRRLQYVEGLIDSRNEVEIVAVEACDSRCGGMHV